VNIISWTYWLYSKMDFLLLMLLVCWSGVYCVGVGFGLRKYVSSCYVDQGVEWVGFVEILLVFIIKTISALVN